MDLRMSVMSAWLVMVMALVWDAAAAPAATRKLLYRTSSTDGNKSARDEVAYLDPATNTLQVYGRYAFVAPSGVVATVYYYADKDGYRASTSLGGEATPEGFPEPGDVGPLAGVPIIGEGEKGGYETEFLPPEVLKSLLG